MRRPAGGPTHVRYYTRRYVGITDGDPIPTLSEAKDKAASLVDAGYLGSVVAIRWRGNRIVSEKVVARVRASDPDFSRRVARWHEARYPRAPIPESDRRTVDNPRKRRTKAKRRARR